MRKYKKGSSDTSDEDDSELNVNISDNEDVNQTGQIRFSLFRTENGTALFPRAASPIGGEYMRNTLQPISSEASGHS